MSEKKSQFIEVETLADSQYVPVFGSGVDRKISKPNLFKQIKDESFSPFIYPTIAILQSADLEVDVDNPIYCRCEETEYRLYKITNAAPGVDDITLTNGNTAEYQIEYRDTGFVTSVATAATGALAVFTDSTGQEIDKSVVPTNTGKALVQAADSASIAFPRKNADNTVTMRSASQYFDDIKQSATHGAAGVIKTADGTSTLAQTATDEAITPANLATLKASNAETLTGTDDTKYITPENLQHKLESDGVLIIENVAALASTPVVAGTVYYLKEYYDGTGYGGGDLEAYVGVDTPNNGTIFASGTAGTLLKRINYTEISAYFFGIKSDGTDQTSNITTMFTSLGSSFFGTIYIPQNVVFDFNVVADALPPRAILRDESGINAWNSPGFRQKIVGWVDGDDDSAVHDFAFGVSSGHNATIVLDNRQTASSSSGQKGIAMVMWTKGRFDLGQPGYRGLARVEWSENPGTGKWFYVLRRMVPWEARDHENWAAGQSIATNDYTLTSAGVYKATSTGTTGATEPTWLKGVTSSDGGVSWICINNRIDDSVFSVNENGELALNASPTAGIVGYMKANPDSDGEAALYVEAANASKNALLKLRPTDGSGNVVLMPYHLAQNGIGVRLVSSAASLTGYTMTDSLGFQLGTYSKKSATATNGDTTPDITDVGMLILANSGATSITALDGAVTQREVDLFFENGNTTLVHNASTFVLKGGVNVTPAANTIITMVKYVNSAAWFEKTRSF
jgi:hypothetical protein